MDYKNRITPPYIKKLKDNEVFVFGSNIMGRHGKGAAKDAMNFGAKYGKGEGIQGKTYAIPTKGEDLKKSLSLEEIEQAVLRFKEYVDNNPKKTYLVTEIGCGLANYKPRDIAPLFKGLVNNKTVYFSENFWKKLKSYINES